VGKKEKGGMLLFAQPKSGMPLELKLSIFATTKDIQDMPSLHSGSSDLIPESLAGYTTSVTQTLILPV
jgi:hypothetical protein